MDYTFIQIIIDILTVLLAGSLLSIAWQMRRRLAKPKEQIYTVEDRIRILSHSLAEVTNLISQIEAEVRTRSALVEKLKKDAELYNQIVEINKPEVEAVAQLLRGELKQESKKNFWLGVAVNFVFFVLGALTGFLLK
jgi:t-SNARE complex subunit (syntaxin)